MDWSLPGSSVPRILQARLLKWVTISSSRGSSQPGIKPESPVLQAGSLPWTPWEAPVTLTSHQLSDFWVNIDRHLEISEVVGFHSMALTLGQDTRKDSLSIRFANYIVISQACTNNWVKVPIPVCRSSSQCLVWKYCWPAAPGTPCGRTSYARSCSRGQRAEQREGSRAGLASDDSVKQLLCQPACGKRHQVTRLRRNEGINEFCQVQDKALNRSPKEGWAVRCSEAPIRAPENKQVLLYASATKGLKPVKEWRQ